MQKLGRGWQGLAALALTGIVAGCGTTPVYVEATYEADLDAAWRACLTIVDVSYDLQTLNKSDGLFHTSWRSELHPFRYEGKRRRVHGRLETVEEGGTSVAIRVEAEKNADIDAPLDIRRAKWKSLPDDEYEARKLQELVRLEIDRAKRVRERVPR